MHGHAASQEEIAGHFNEVAKEYDYWKKKNWYYYDALRAIAQRHTPSGARVLDAGCGTGAMIHAVAPVAALGVDISPEMVEIAKRRYSDHPAWKFVAADITTFTTSEQFESVLFFDVIEHVVDTPAALRALRKTLSPEGTLIVTMANPLWEPILMVAEKLGLKMPEGPHHRLSSQEMVEQAKEAGLTLKQREWSLLVPKYVPLFSWFLNSVLGRLPLVERLAVIEVYLFVRE